MGASSKRRVSSSFVQWLGGAAFFLLSVAPLRSADAREFPRRLDPQHFDSQATADWHKPPPRSLDATLKLRIPYGLITAVSAPRIGEATTLLGRTNVVALTVEQVAHLSSPTNPEAALQARIDEVTETIRLFRLPSNEAVDKLLVPSEIRAQKRRRIIDIDRLTVELRQLMNWKQGLKPFLIMAVALQAGGSFEGTLVDDKLVINFVAVGSTAIPMERRPVIAFLPRKPRRIYTEVAMVR